MKHAKGPWSSYGPWLYTKVEKIPRKGFSIMPRRWFFQVLQRDHDQPCDSYTLVGAGVTRTHWGADRLATQRFNEILGWDIMKGKAV